MAIYDSKLAMIVEALGRYYSVVSKEKFMSILAFGDDNAISSFGSVNLDPTPEMNKLVRTFTDATEGGVIMTKNFTALKDIATGDEAGEIEQMAQKLYRYVGEPSAFETIWDSSWTKVCSQISVSDFCKISPGTDGSRDGTINGAFASPTKFTPNLCALEVKNPKLVPAARDSGAAGLFMNCIPTLEFSRLQPHLDITLVSPRDGMSDSGKIQSIGLMQHLIGQSQPSSDVNKSLASAVDESAVQGMLEAADADAAAGGADTQVSSADIAVSTAGMEMFTAPQTLVPHINGQLETYGDYESFSNVIGDDGEPISSGGRRGAAIIDPFRPLMSIEGFAITVSPSRGMMSHKTAELTLTLHDRSRLSEVAEFVKPDLYGHSELMITYGWSHPDDSASTSTDGVRSGNFYGSFLNAMKITEKYMIVNSSFSFDEVGQVKIKLKLSMKGASNLDTNNIGQGEDVETAVQALQDMVEVIRQLKATAISEASSMGGGSEARDVFGESFFSAASDTSRAMTIDEETQKALKKYISDNRGASGTTGELAGTLENMFGSDGTGGAVEALQKTIADAISAKMSHLVSLRTANKDPFAKTITGNEGSTKYVNITKRSSKHVSLGALVMYMVGKPLASTKRFDEIQFIFYPVNDKASYIKDCTTAEIPINMVDFQKTFKENTKTSINLPLGRFMSMVGKEFVHNQASEAYGLAALYDTDEEGKKKVKEDLSEDPTKLNDEKKKRLEDAYGMEADMEFKMPRIRFHLEAVPAKETGHDEGRRSTILRIHVYDSVCTPHTALGKLMAASRSNSLGLLTSAASKAARPATPDTDSDEAEVSVSHADAFYDELQKALDYGLLEAVPSLSEDDTSGYDPATQPNTYFRVKGGFKALKNFMQASMPTIIYGSTNSAVLSADVASMNNPKLASMNMMRSGMGGGTTAQGARDAGVPLQTAPVTLSLTTLGCPVVSYGQSFFVDFGTGTTVDNVFVVSGISHTIQKGKFETKLKMTQVDAFGKYASMMGNVTKALTALSESKEE
jgi:hypothetical protein